MIRRTEELIRTLAAAAVAVVLLAGTTSMASAVEAKVDLNSATVSELAELPGIGPAKAAAIVEERTVEPFGSVDDLARVRGIGEATLADLEPLVSVKKAKQ